MEQSKAHATYQLRVHAVSASALRCLLCWPFSDTFPHLACVFFMCREHIDWVQQKTQEIIKFNERQMSEDEDDEVKQAQAKEKFFWSIVTPGDGASENDTARNWAFVSAHTLGAGALGCAKHCPGT